MKNLNEELFFEILQGRFDNIPKGHSRAVRIFLSSTFTGNKKQRKKFI
jgi:hypothetical protein